MLRCLFDPLVDLLGLVTAPLASQLDGQLQELLRWASMQDGRRLLDQVAYANVGSAAKRQLLTSIHCPSILATTYGITHEDTGALLQRLRCLQFDFDHLPSSDEQMAIRLCRDLLTSGSIEDGRLLWRTLITLAETARPLAGYYDLRKLVSEVGAQFDLVQFPQYRRDWQKIRAWTANNLQRIPSEIGRQVSLPREDVIEEISHSLSQNKAVVLTGTSGCGKTVLTKMVAQKRLPALPVIWFDAKMFESGTFLNPTQVIGLNHELSEVAASFTGFEVLCIVDNLGALVTDDGIGRLRSLIDSFATDNSNSAWRLLLTCQHEDWDRVQLHLFQIGVPIQQWCRVKVEPPKIDTLQPVWDAFPVLAPLKYQRELWPLLLRPKVLDLLASHVALGEEVHTYQWAGESSLIQWFWQKEMAKPPHAATRSNFLKALAARQADELQVDTESAQLGDGAVLDTLINDKVCSLRDEMVSFSHDLYADWARQRILLEKAQSGLKDYLNSRLSSPFWHRAIRLYGLHLLEQHSDASLWKAAIDELGSGDSEGNLAQDLLLEAIIFATRPVTLFDRTWEYLVENEGHLLRRLLGRFLYVATDPNPFRLDSAQSSGSAGSVLGATVDRIPYWPYWLPVLRFLHKHSEAVIRLAPEQVAHIAYKWLQYTETGVLYRKEVAQIALTLAETALKNEWNYRYPKALTKISYQAVLASGGELPIEVTDFVKRASGRIARPPREVAREHQPRLRLPRATSTNRLRTPTSSWLHGPIQQAHDEFATLCLETSSIFPLIDSLPEVAGEALLALIIRVRPDEEIARDSEGNSLGLEDLDEHSLGVKYLDEYYPPFYYHFPWLYFLHAHPQVAIDTILKLINFATDQWFDGQRDAPLSVLLLRSNAQLDWMGDATVYYWYRDNVDTPFVITSVLMALEKWLYNKVDKDENVDSYLQQIIEGSRSVAFAGLLSAVAKRHHNLLEAPLRFLITSPEFLWWERMYHLAERERYATAGWFSQGETSIQLALEWHNMPHRSESLFEVARANFLADSGSEFFKYVRDEWRARRDVAEQRGDVSEVDILERIISAFDPNDYTTAIDSEHNRLVITHTFPERIRERSSEPLEEIRLSTHILTFPMRCRKLIDDKTPLSEVEAEEFWQTLQQLAALPEDSFASGRPSRADCICGGVTVLLTNCRDWLRQNPEHNNWCCEQVLTQTESYEIMGDDRGHRYIEHTVHGWSWDDFSAEAVALLWSENLHDSRVRQAIVILAMNSRYDVVSILCKAIFRHRSTVGEQFLKVQHFLRVWSVERKAIQILRRRYETARVFASRDTSEPGDSEEELLNSLNEDAKTIFESLESIAAAFDEDTLSTNLPSLVVPVDALERTWRTERHGRDRRPRQEYTVDISLVQAMYSWIPSLDLASNDAEREQWIGYWKDILACFLYTLRELPEDAGEEREIDGAPFDEDRWLLGRLSELVFQMHEEEHPEEIYGPVLALGCVAHYWVEDFLRHFFIDHLNSRVIATSEGRFANIWSAMISYAARDSSWRRETGKRRWHLGELWQHLMGLDPICSSLWSENMVGLVDRMRGDYERWAQEYMGGTRDIEAFMRFLCQPAAVNLRLNSLSWLEQAIYRSNRDLLGEVGTSLSRLLALIWETRGVEFEHNIPANTSFKNLVRSLSDAQNAVALEIQRRMTEGTRTN